MIKDKKKIGIIDYSERIKEVSIRKNFPVQKRIIPEEINFLYCDPPEVILQSNFFLKKMSRKTKCMRFQ